MAGKGPEEGRKVARIAPMAAELGDLGANPTCRRIMVGRNVH
jgi:hypothetical protein